MGPAKRFVLRFLCTFSYFSNQEVFNIFHKIFHHFLSFRLFTFMLHCTQNFLIKRKMGGARNSLPNFKIKSTFVSQQSLKVTYPTIFH